MTEIGWVLVTYRPSIRYLYVTTGGNFDWSENNLHALRLCRQEDAVALSRIVAWGAADVKVEEHAWE